VASLVLETVTSKEVVKAFAREEQEKRRFAQESEESLDAAKAAQAHDFIMMLSDGYDTVLRDGGANLSGGQRQRIALARAILKNAQIFILDEPVTGVDAATEAKLNETLDRHMEGKTSFTIAHRFSTIMRADLILMIGEGQVVEQGTHEQLFGKNDRYRQLYDLQRGEPGGNISDDTHR
jgi:ABC-type multidrug transport system fused ATPase/permease subunit